ncbi:short chain dehydrogenase [Streptomyces sp. NPDC058378]|uniref:short chain dehydrogenase n=1 Tax=Streptomyces sp. NPDC058378 TaxID=3346469 RepID=UPI00364A21A6
MKVLVIGATGTIGSAVAHALEASRHQVVTASRRGPVKVDIEDPSSLDALLDEVADLDAVVCCAASGPLVDLQSVTEEVAAGVQGKLLGQVALVRRAARRLRDGGSVTLTGGTFATPLAGGSLGALVNTGLEGFVRNAADELPRGLRVNLISPGWIRETLESMGADGSEGTPVSQVAQAYVTAVEGTARGRTVRP